MTLATIADRAYVTVIQARQSKKELMAWTLYEYVDHIELEHGQ